MKANELRIGNLVSNYGDFVKVDMFDDIDIFNSNTGEIPLLSIQPIPLTPEILLKAGFEKSNENEYNYNQIFIKFLEYDKIQFCNPTVYGGIIKCQYVHQLQNLYFALTGQELIFDL